MKGVRMKFCRVVCVANAVAGCLSLPACMAPAMAPAIALAGPGEFLGEDAGAAGSTAMQLARARHRIQALEGQLSDSENARQALQDQVKVLKGVIEDLKRQSS